LGSIYAILTLLIFRLIGHFKPTSWPDKISQKKFKFWLITGALISVFLLVFSSTHWGSHGLGDSAIIPLQNGKVIKQINGSQAYIDVKYEYGNLWIGEFAKTSDFVLGKTEVSTVDDPENFFVWE